MNNIGFILAQWLLPAVRVWPIFTLFIVLMVIAVVFNRKEIAKKLGIGVLILGCLLLLLRGMVLVLTPYGEREYDISLAAAANHDLLIDYNGGRITVKTENSDTFLFKTFDLKGVKPFRVAQTTRIEDGQEIGQEMVHLAGMEGYSLLTESDSVSTVIVPKEYMRDQYFRLISTDAVLDLRNTASAKISVNMQYSRATVQLPVSSRNVYIDLSGAFSPITISYDPRMTIILDDNHNAMRSEEIEHFTQEKRQYYVHKGIADMGTITVYARVSPRTLALLEDSGQ